MCSWRPEVNWLADHVRWDIEEDLARVIGDAPAHTLGQVARRMVEAMRQLRRRRQCRCRWSARRRAMTRLVRGLFIVWVVLRFGLDELFLNSFEKPWLRLLARVVSVGRRLDAPRGQRLRQALERLGPIFVKFGQVLSTRRDLLPIDIADELAHLQDRVPPFGSDIAVATIERAFRQAGWRDLCLVSSVNPWPVRRSPRCILRS